MAIRRTTGVERMMWLLEYAGKLYTQVQADLLIAKRKVNYRTLSSEAYDQEVERIWSEAGAPLTIEVE
jgi:hypothetical protein